MGIAHTIAAVGVKCRNSSNVISNDEARCGVVMNIESFHWLLLLFVQSDCCESLPCSVHFAMGAPLPKPNGTQSCAGGRLVFVYDASAFPSLQAQPPPPLAKRTIIVVSECGNVFGNAVAKYGFAQNRSKQEAVHHFHCHGARLELRNCIMMIVMVIFAEMLVSGGPPQFLSHKWPCD